MSVCNKYMSYYILIVYLQYIVVLSLLSCLHEENEPENGRMDDEWTYTWIIGQIQVHFLHENKK